MRPYWILSDLLQHSLSFELVVSIGLVESTLCANTALISYVAFAIAIKIKRKQSILVPQPHILYGLPHDTGMRLRR